MSSLPITKKEEAEAVARVWNMGCQSLPPYEYTKLEEIFEILCATRSIDNEQVAYEHIELKGKDGHHSDCRTSDAPALLPGPCNCTYRE